MVLFVCATGLVGALLHFAWAEGTFAVTWHRTSVFFIACLFSPLLCAIFGLGWTVVVIGLFESFGAFRLADAFSSRLGGLMAAFTLLGLAVPISGFAYVQWQLVSAVQDLTPLLMTDEMASLRPKDRSRVITDWKYEGDPPSVLTSCKTNLLEGSRYNQHAKGIIVDCGKRPKVLPAHIYLTDGRRAGADEVSWVAFACSNRVPDAWTQSHGFKGSRVRVDVEQMKVTIMDRLSEATLATGVVERVPITYQWAPNSMYWTDPPDVASFVVDCLGRRAKASNAPPPQKNKAEQQ
ncbi:MAG: hypothetical protein HN348_01315 [Proteobacteria bacterium]|jgi:hypothetical protein|nr:hypothetical protein [Pseudomonadota bacterium]